MRATTRLHVSQGAKRTTTAGAAEATSRCTLCGSPLRLGQRRLVAGCIPRVDAPGRVVSILPRTGRVILGVRRTNTRATIGMYVSQRARETTTAGAAEPTSRCISTQSRFRHSQRRLVAGCIPRVDALGRVGLILPPGGHVTLGVRRTDTRATTRLHVSRRANGTTTAGATELTSQCCSSQSLSRQSQRRLAAGCIRPVDALGRVVLILPQGGRAILGVRRTEIRAVARVRVL